MCILNRLYDACNAEVVGKYGTLYSLTDCSERMCYLNPLICVLQLCQRVSMNRSAKAIAIVATACLVAMVTGDRMQITDWSVRGQRSNHRGDQQTKSWSVLRSFTRYTRYVLLLLL